MQREQKITLGQMRSDGGPRRLLVYCPQYTHNIVVDADQWGDAFACQTSKPKFSCKSPAFEKAKAVAGLRRIRME